jgi:hypothetical protein
MFSKSFEKANERKPTTDEIQTAQWQYILLTITESEIQPTIDACAPRTPTGEEVSGMD